MKYVILHPTQPNSGMFAFVWHVLRGIYHYPGEKYYIYFGRECCYYDNDITHTNNVWEYYFKQPHTDILYSEDEIIAEVGLIHDECSEYRDVYMQNVTPEFLYKRRCEYNDIITKNVRLLPHMNDKITSFYDIHFKNKKVLGLHCRGTDHPGKKSMETHISSISNIFDDYDVLFATSDELGRIEFLRKIFGNKLITYDSIRSSSECQLHYQNSNKINPYRIGEDVIIESYLLSKTNFLICCPGSNVNFYSRALNPELNFIYL